MSQMSIQSPLTTSLIQAGMGTREINAQANTTEVIQNPVQAFQNARQAGEQAIPRADRSSIADSIKNAFAKVGTYFKEAAIATFSKTAGLPENLTLNVHGKLLNYSGKELANMISSLPRAERQNARENIEDIFTQRIDRGESMMQNILDGVPPNREGQSISEAAQDASDLMLFLDAKTRASTNSSFSNGSFSIEDPQGRLYDFLDTSSAKYIRSSSHLESDQHERVTSGGQTHDNLHRGIDFTGIDGRAALPKEDTTVLFAVIPANQEQGSTQRLFLKPESFGCRISTFSESQKEPGRSTPDRPVNLRTDIKSFIGHTCSFISSRLAGAGADTRKEHMPSSTIADFKTIQESSIFAPVANTLNANNPLSNARGLHVMLTNLRNAIQEMPIGEAKNALVRAASEFAENAGNNFAEVNSLSSRIGNEVMFDQSDIRTPLEDTHQTYLTPGKKADIIRNQIIPQTQDPALDVLEGDNLLCARANLSQIAQIMSEFVNLSKDELGADNLYNSLKEASATIPYNIRESYREALFNAALNSCSEDTRAMMLEKGISDYADFDNFS